MVGLVVNTRQMRTSNPSMAASRTTYAALVLGLILLGLQQGCAFATTNEGMAPPSLRVVRETGATVNLKTTGGRATRPWGRSQISNEVFSESVAVALVRAGLLRPLIDKAADFQLEAALVELNQPLVSLRSRVDVGIAWKLWRTETREVVWEETLRTHHTTTIADALFGTRRCRLATEGAARANIAVAIDRLSQLDLAGTVALR